MFIKTIYLNIVFFKALEIAIYCMSLINVLITTLIFWAQLFKINDVVS